MRIRARLITKNYELEERRKLLGYSQEDFADIVGITTTMYQKIEQLKLKPTEDLAESIAIELNVSKDILFPEGYEKLVEVFNTKFERIADYTPPLLEVDETRLLEQTDARLTVNSILKELSPKERNLIEMRYGINGKQQKTLEEAGKELGVTRERIRQIEAKTAEKIRVKLQENHYEHGK